MFSLFGSAFAIFFASPLGISQAFIAPTTDSSTRLAVVRPLGNSTHNDAERFLAQMDKIRDQCKSNGWQLKSTLFNGLRAGQTIIDQDALAGAMKEQGFNQISVITCEFQALDKGKEFNRISFMFIYAYQQAKWRLVEIEPLEVK